MIIKVGHRELNDVTKNLKQDKEDFDKEIENMLDEIERLKAVWKGTDASIFYEKVTDYIKNMKKITKAMDTISKFGDKANEGYVEVDESFSKELEKEAANHGEDDPKLKVQL